MSQAEPMLVLYGDNPATVLANLLALSARSGCRPRVLVAPWYATPQLTAELGQAFKYFSYRQGRYSPDQLTCPLEIVACPSAQLPPLEPRTAFLPSPIRISGGADLEIELDEWQEEISAYLTAAGAPLAEDLLQTALAQHLPLVDKLELPATVPLLAEGAAACLALEDAAWESFWQGPEGQLYRYLLDLQLGRDDSLPRHQLNQAIRLGMDAPGHLGAQLVLLLYQRTSRAFQPYLAAAPASFQALYAHATSRGRHLEILPPVRDFRVTVVVVTANRLAKFQNTIRSIREQTYADWQCLIADWGSTDGTEAYCLELCAEDPRFAYFRQEIPPGFACVFKICTLAFDRVQTELAVFCADDDFLTPRCLEKTVSFLRQCPWLAMVGGGYFKAHLSKASPGNLPLQQHGPYADGNTIALTRRELQRCGFDNPVFGGGALYRKEILRELRSFEPGFLDTGYAFNDWLITWKCLVGYEVGLVDSPAAIYMIYPGTGQLKHSPVLLHVYQDLARYMLEDYAALFAEAFPYPIMAYFLNMIVQPFIEAGLYHQYQVSGGQSSLAAWMEGNREWEYFLALKEELLSHCSHEAPLLVTEETHSGLRDIQPPPDFQPWLLSYLRPFLPA